MKFELGGLLRRTNKKPQAENPEVVQPNPVEVSFASTDTAPSIVTVDNTPTETTENIENTERNKKEKKPKPVFDLNQVADTMREKVFELRSELEVEHLEKGGTGFTEEQETTIRVMEQEVAFKAFMKAKENHQRERLEGSPKIKKAVGKGMDWYQKLEDTPKGKTLKNALSTGLASGAFLGTAAFFEMLSPGTAVIKLGIRVSTTVGMKYTMKKLVDKNPKLADKFFNLFKGKNSTDTGIPVEGSATSTEPSNFETTSITQAPVFDESTVDTTLDKKDVSKFKYYAIAGGTVLTLLTAGILPATFTGLTLAAKEGLADLIKIIVDEKKDKLGKLYLKIELFTDAEKFLENLKEIEKQVNALTKTIERLEKIRNIIKSSITFANGLGGTYFAPHVTLESPNNLEAAKQLVVENAKGSLLSRRLVTEPANVVEKKKKEEIKQKQKELEKIYKKKQRVGIVGMDNPEEEDKLAA